MPGSGVDRVTNPGMVSLITMQMSLTIMILVMACHTICTLKKMCPIVIAQIVKQSAMKQRKHYII